MRVALLKNSDICYGSLVYFLSCVETVLNNYSVQTKIFTRLDEELINTKWDAVIGINQTVLSTKLSNGTFLFDYLNCPLFAIIVDPPYHIGELLREHPKNLHLICLDTGHVEYGKKYYGPLKSVQMGYLIGPMASPLPYEDRAMDVLFMGSRIIEDELYGKIESFPQEWMKSLFDYLIRQAKESPNIAMEYMVREFFKDNNINISDKEFKKAMETAGGYAEYYLRSYYREQILSILINSGVNVTVAGTGWEDFFKHVPDNLTFIGSVDFAESANTIVKSKIFLNVMPWFKDGIHDRILTSMYNEVVCVTDGSSYIREHFTDGEDLIIYDLQRLEELPNKIYNILENPEKAERIIQNARQKVQNDFTWENFVKNQILSHIL